MKKTVARKAFAAASALIMCGNTMAFAGESTGSTTTPQFEDRVALDVVAFVGSGELDGLRSDPVSKYIEDNLNIDLYLTAVTEADWPTQLSAMLADNDLPDVFLLSDPTKQLPMLLESASVLNLEPYLEEYAPNTMSDPAGQLMVAAERMPDRRDAHISGDGYTRWASRYEYGRIPVFLRKGSRRTGPDCTAQFRFQHSSEENNDQSLSGGYQKGRHCLRSAHRSGYAGVHGRYSNRQYKEHTYPWRAGAV